MDERRKQSEKIYKAAAQRLEELNAARREVLGQLKKHDVALQDLPLQLPKVVAWAAERRRLVDAFETLDDLYGPAAERARHAERDWKQAQLNYPVEA